MSKEKKQRLKAFLDEFKTFINRGNVVDLAVGVIVGGAFSKIVSSLVSDILMPLIGLFLGGANFSSLALTAPNIFGGNSHTRIPYGNFIQNIVDFLIIAFSVFIFVRFINHLQEDKLKKDKLAEKTKKPTDTELSILKEIRDLLQTQSSPIKPRTTKSAQSSTPQNPSKSAQSPTSQSPSKSTTKPPKT